MKDIRAELIRINDKGEAHPIGVVASQRMRARAGAHRLLPAPDHVVFMRYTGEDGKRDESDGAVVRMAGEITAPGAMCDVLAMLAQAGWRGELVVHEEKTRRSIFFDQGNVVGVETNVDDERLGQVLYKFGAVDTDQYEQILERVRGGQRLGAAAVGLGVLSQEQVYKYIGKQVEEVVFATLTVGDGTFFFLDGFDESRLVSRQFVSASALLMDGVTRMDEVRYFRQKIPSSDYVPSRVEGKEDPDEEFAKVWPLIDGKNNVEEIGRRAGLGEFVTTKQVYTLLQSKHVLVHPPRMSGGPEAVVETANSALRAIFHSADAEGKGDEVRASLESFAVGAGVYDMLFRNAGPDQNGALTPSVVAQNSVLVAGGPDTEQVLKQMLYEYVSFALFSAGGALGSDQEAKLKKSIGPILGQLRPQG